MSGRVRIAGRAGCAARAPVAWMARVAECAVAKLGIRGRDVFSIALLDRRTMARLNQRYTGHNGLTDVLSFRYDGGPGSQGARGGRRGAGAVSSKFEVRSSKSRMHSAALIPSNFPLRTSRSSRGPRAEARVIGEILVSPDFARDYARAHGLPYREELARYVIHGLLHWVGHDDRTPAQQRRMRRMEDRLLAQCAPSSKFEVRSSKSVGSTLRTSHFELRATE